MFNDKLTAEMIKGRNKIHKRANIKLTEQGRQKLRQEEFLSGGEASGIIIILNNIRTFNRSSHRFFN